MATPLVVGFFFLVLALYFGAPSIYTWIQTKLRTGKKPKLFLFWILSIATALGMLSLIIIMIPRTSFSTECGGAKRTATTSAKPCTCNALVWKR